MAAKLDGPSLKPASGKAKKLVVFLHGYGANGTDLLAMGLDWAQDMPDTAFVAPNAPEVCAAWAQGYQWFPIKMSEPITQKSLDRKELVMKPAKMLDAYLDEQLAQWKLDESKMAVVGFSQGAGMATYVMPRRLKACAGIVSYSGMLIDANGLKGERIVKPAVLAIHGAADQIVPVSCLDDMESGFEAAGFYVEAIRRPGMVHTIDEFSFTRGRMFLQEVLEKKTKK